MNRLYSGKSHILILFSATGGGHQAVAEGISEALQTRYGGDVTTEMVDFIKDYAPLPFNRTPDWYPRMVRAPRLWSLGYHVTDGRVRARAISATLWPYVSRSARALVNRHPSDLIVTVHPLATSMILKALGANRPPFVTVVTDYVTNHAFWYDKRADIILVPTEEARQGAIKYSMDPAKVHVVGMPAPARYCAPSGDKTALRQKLGWPLDIPIVLAAGGMEGMGPLAKTVEAIAESGLDVGLMVVAGRNIKLKLELEKRSWAVPHVIYGFTREMPQMLRAADVIVTKAGAATVTEALNAHLPMVFYSRVPGQEDGNVEFVVSQGAGIWAPSPALVVEALSHWIAHPESMAEARAACQRVARPDSANRVADILAQRMGLAPSTTS